MNRGAVCMGRVSLCYSIRRTAAAGPGLAPGEGGEDDGTWWFLFLTNLFNETTTEDREIRILDSIIAAVIRESDLGPS